MSIGGAAAVFALVAGVALMAEIPRVTWDVALRADAQEYELRSAALAPDGSDVWVAVSARPRGALGGPEQPLLLRISAAGQVAATPTDVVRVPDMGTVAERRAIQGMAFGADGSLMVAVDRPSRESALLTVAPGSVQVGPVRGLAFEGGDPQLARLVALRDARLLAVGAFGARGFVAEVAPDGRVVWQRVLDVEGLTLDDVAPTVDGGAVVAGRQGLDMDTRVWIGRLSPKGELTQQAQFPGWVGSIAEGRDGGYLLVTTEQGRQGNVVLRVLADDFAEQSSRRVPAGQPITPPWRVVASPDGGYVVAGIQQRGLWLARLGPDGATVWEESRTPVPPVMEAATNVELLAAKDAFVVLYTAFAVDGTEQRQFVRAIRFGG